MTTTGENSRPELIRYDAGGVADGSAAAFAPGSLLLRRGLEGLSVLAVGSGAEVDHHPGAAAATVMGLPGAVLIPGLVNAHAHLDLTHVGPVPPDPEGGFAAFARVVMGNRRTDPAQIAESVRRGVELCLAGGTVAIGDIAGSPRTGPTLEPWRALRRSPLLGVSYLEFFGIGRTAEPGRERVRAVLLEAMREAADGRVKLGLQPHAPYTVSPGLYAWAAAEAARLGLPLSTHLAETPDERRFIGEGAGAMRDLLEALGIWDDAAAAAVGHGLHPVRHLERFLSARPLLAHVNDASDEAIELLARSWASVAYCPRSSEYFGAERHFGPHRYRDMLAAGVNVCLGTDSIINLPAAAADPARGGISVLDEMRLLHARDGTDPALLLAMATVHGARALGLPDSMFTLSERSTPAGIVAVDVRGTDPSLPPLGRLLQSRWPARLL